jgi:voltage-gated potassium channel
LAIGLLIVIGTIGYMVLEGLPPLEALYLLVITVTTVGYGDLHPVTAGGRILTMLLVPMGLLLVFGLGVATMAGRLDDMIFRGGAGALRRKIAGLKDHFIVCGYGRVGRGTAAMLRKLGGTVVVVERDPEQLRDIPPDIFPVAGDALEEEVLLQAGIRRARSLIATFSDDTLNVYLVLEARDIRPDIEVTSTASSRESSRRLYLAGASRVVSPQVLGADILAKSAYNPAVYQLMSDMIGAEPLGGTITQVVVAPDSSLVGRSLGDFKELGIGGRVLLVRTPTSTVLSPSGDLRLEAGWVLVVIGEAAAIEKLERMASA